MDWGSILSVAGVFVAGFFAYLAQRKTAQVTETGDRTNARIEERRVDNEQFENQRESWEGIIAAQQVLLTAQREAMVSTISELKGKVDGLENKVSEIESKWREDRSLLEVAIRFIRDIMRVLERELPNHPQFLTVPEALKDEINRR